MYFDLYGILNRFWFSKVLLYYFVISHFQSSDIVVYVATNYRLYSLGFKSWKEEKLFCCPKPYSLALDSCILLFIRYQGSSRILLSVKKYKMNSSPL